MSENNLELLNMLLKDAFVDPEDKCTCKEFSKQRALCPVCDKEEYEKSRADAETLKSPSSMDSSTLYTYERDGGKAKIGTFTGRFVDVINPELEDIDIEDIAHALSHGCRFGGHTREFYSVAQHSILCSYMTTDLDYALEALMHDASEAYLIDVPRPIKIHLSNYKEIENNLMTLIAKKFGFTWPLHESVKVVDEVLLQLEWDSLMINKNNTIVPMTSKEAKSEFLRRFHELTQIKQAHEKDQHEEA